MFEIVRPFPVVLLVLGVCLARAWFSLKEKPQRRQLLWLIVPYSLILTMSIPAVAWLALFSIECQHPPCNERPDGIHAIVILGSDVNDPIPALDRAELDGYGLDRVRHGAGLYHQGAPCPVVVSGGLPNTTRPVAPMAQSMAVELRRLGVAECDLIIEDQSRTTYENAVESVRILHQRGYQRILLVTDAQHMPRAVGCFRKQGVEVVPSACRYRAVVGNIRVRHFVPNGIALLGVQDAAHEWSLLMISWVRGRI